MSRKKHTFVFYFSKFAMNQNKNDIPEPTLRRLPWYLAYSQLSLKKGITTISSKQIAKDIGLDASKVAKDLSYLNISGKTRVGYNIKDLVTFLEEFLGFAKPKKAFLFGVGNLGGALMHDNGLNHFGLDIVAGFDTKHELSGTSINHIPIHHIDNFEKLKKQTGVNIAILTVPVDKAQEVTNRIIDSGMQAIWNFTPFRIKVPKNIIVQNTSIYAHLAVMFNRLKLLNDTKE